MVKWCFLCTPLGLVSQTKGPRKLKMIRQRALAETRRVVDVLL